MLVLEFIKWYPIWCGQIVWQCKPFFTHPRSLIVSRHWLIIMLTAFVFTSVTFDLVAVCIVLVLMSLFLFVTVTVLSSRWSKSRGLAVWCFDTRGALGGVQQKGRRVSGWLRASAGRVYDWCLWLKCSSKLNYMSMRIPTYKLISMSAASVLMMLRLCRVEVKFCSFSQHSVMNNVTLSTDLNSLYVFIDLLLMQ